MRYRTLGGSDLEVSEVSMGLWAISNDDTWGPQDEADAIDAIHAAADVGVNFFDTAEGYGDGYSEEVLGRALDDLDRSEVLIGTKVLADNLRPDDLREACEGSLDRIGTDYLDLYTVHWPNHDVPIEETMGAMKDLQDEGTIRAIGVSNFGARDLRDALDEADVVADQLPYSLLWRAIEHEIQEVCRENDVGITAYSPLMQGLLVPLWDSPDEVPDGRARTRLFSADRPMARHGEEGAEEETFETVDRVRRICDEAGVSTVHAAIAWVLSRPAVSHVLVGGRNPEEIRDSAAAAEVDLPGDVEDRLTDATEELKETVGTNPDLWHEESQYR